MGKTRVRELTSAQRSGLRRSERRPGEGIAGGASADDVDEEELRETVDGNR
jgi:hypothetical protein